MEFRINENTLEIIDRRKDTFLWCFEVVLENKLRIGDAFTLGNKIYSVSYINEIDNENILSEIENVISEYNATIEYFNENPDYTKYHYHFECEHEELKCNDIFDVYQNVLDRKP